MLVRIFLLTVLAAVATANCGSSDPAYTGEIRVAAPNVQILYKVEGAYIRLRATLLSGAGVCYSLSRLPRISSFASLSLCKPCCQPAIWRRRSASESAYYTSTVHFAERPLFISTFFATT